MLNTPKSLRLQIALFGRTNVGKSSFLNMLANQDVSITSPVPGTTTDIVEKSMELLPVGPVTFLDTGGMDDTSELSTKRIEKAKKIFARADIVVLIAEPNIWTEFEDSICESVSGSKTNLIIVINKSDICAPDDSFIEIISTRTKNFLICSSLVPAEKEDNIIKFINIILRLLPEEFTKPLPLIGDLIPRIGTAILIVPIDNEAPKGRIILPQVQAIRDLLDFDSMALVVKEHQYLDALRKLKSPPDIVVCDSQVVHLMVEQTPPDVKCTTFSILFSRYKGDLTEEVRGVAALAKLEDGDRVLIAESCSHHPNEDDIGRVKIPRWLQQKLGKNLNIDICAGRDFPSNLQDYKAVIHCGGCMITRTEKLARIHFCKQAGVPITNYGVTISYLQGVLERVLEPFPAELEEYRKRL